jgi:hypothetical protein
MQVTYYQFCATLAADFRLELYHKHIIRLQDYPIKNGKRKINSWQDAVIVTANGKEYPYMLSQTLRNDKHLQDFAYIYINRPKSLPQLLQEAGITLKSKSCRICEGNEWYRTSVKYFYKDIYCEV